MKADLAMDEVVTPVYFQHSWWRILLIIFSLVAFIITCVFNGLAGGGPNGKNRFNKFCKT